MNTHAEDIAIPTAEWSIDAARARNHSDLDPLTH